MEGGAYIGFRGVLDISRRDEVVSELERCAHARSVVINLSRVEHVDSLVLGLFVSSRRRFIEAGGDPSAFILVVQKGSGLDRMFAVTALDRLFDIAYAQDEGSMENGPEKSIAEPHDAADPTT